MRLNGAASSSSSILFQSTHPRRVRPPAIFTLFIYCLFQSTHPRRVRLCPPPYSPMCRGFNPRTHVGCDMADATIRERYGLFQSTHPRRVRPRPQEPSSAVAGFNPRTHVGCDFTSLHSYSLELFQSTHPRRVRLIAARTATNTHQVSIHAPT